MASYYEPIPATNLRPGQWVRAKAPLVARYQDLYPGLDLMPSDRLVYLARIEDEMSRWHEWVEDSWDYDKPKLEYLPAHTEWYHRFVDVVMRPGVWRVAGRIHKNPVYWVPLDSVA